jgi:hypothetical protein
MCVRTCDQCTVFSSAISHCQYVWFVVPDREQVWSWLTSFWIDIQVFIHLWERIVILYLLYALLCPHRWTKCLISSACVAWDDMQDGFFESRLIIVLLLLLPQVPTPTSATYKSWSLSNYSRAQYLWFEDTTTTTTRVDYIADIRLIQNYQPQFEIDSTSTTAFPGPVFRRNWISLRGQIWGKEKRNRIESYIYAWHETYEIYTIESQTHRHMD